MCGQIYCVHWAAVLFFHLFHRQGLFEWQVEQWNLIKNLFNKTNLLQSSGEVGKLYILATVLALLSIFSVSLFIGVINQNRMFIAPWLWLKYALVALQVIRFVSVIIELAATDKNTVGASPIFELLLLGDLLFHWINFLLLVTICLLLGYNVFSLSIILELVDEIEPYTFKRFEYVRVWHGNRQLCRIYFPFFLNLT